MELCIHFPIAKDDAVSEHDFSQEQFEALLRLVANEKPLVSMAKTYDHAGWAWKMMGKLLLGIAAGVTMIAAFGDSIASIVKNFLSVFRSGG